MEKMARLAVKPKEMKTRKSGRIKRMPKMERTLLIARWMMNIGIMMRA